MYLLAIIVTYVGFIAFSTIISYQLGKTKTENPRTAGILGFILGFLPPLALVYLIILALKEDVGTV